METQVTLRIDQALADRLEERARAAGVKRSALVRAAIEAYLGQDADPAARSVRERTAPHVGAIRDEALVVRRARRDARDLRLPPPLGRELGSLSALRAERTPNR